MVSVTQTFQLPTILMGLKFYISCQTKVPDLIFLAKLKKLIAYCLAALEVENSESFLSITIKFSTNEVAIIICRISALLSCDISLAKPLVYAVLGSRFQGVPANILVGSHRRLVCLLKVVLHSGVPSQALVKEHKRRVLFG